MQRAELGPGGYPHTQLTPTTAVASVEEAERKRPRVPGGGETGKQALVPSRVTMAAASSWGGGSEVPGPACPQLPGCRERGEALQVGAPHSLPRPGVTPPPPELTPGGRILLKVTGEKQGMGTGCVGGRNPSIRVTQLENPLQAWAWKMGGFPPVARAARQREIQQPLIWVPPTLSAASGSHCTHGVLGRMDVLPYRQLTWVRPLTSHRVPPKVPSTPGCDAPKTKQKPKPRPSFGGALLRPPSNRLYPKLRLRCRRETYDEVLFPVRFQTVSEQSGFGGSRGGTRNKGCGRP